MKKLEGVKGPYKLLNDKAFNNPSCEIYKLKPLLDRKPDNMAIGVLVNHLNMNKSNSCDT
jgi:hypothetical protein